MIVVMNRELIIPNEEFNIGTNYDNQTETRLFQLKKVTAGGVDLSNMLFKLDIKYADGNLDTADLTSEVTEREINLTWTITNSVLQVPGTVLTQLRALDIDGAIKWTSYVGAFFVEDAINTPAKYTGDLTELEKFETSEIQRIANETARVAAEAERVASEEIRQSNETERVSQENERIASEDERQSAEKIRISQENERVAAENAREESFNEKALLAQSYAVGGTGIREGEDTDNSKYYKEQSGNYASSAETSKESAEDAKQAAEADAAIASNAASNAFLSAKSASASEASATSSKIDAEAWAKGTRNGVEVSSDDETYHNNAKYYCDAAKEAVGDGVMFKETYDTKGRAEDIFEYVDSSLKNKTDLSEAGANSLISKISEGSSGVYPTDDDYYLASMSGDDSSYTRRKFSTLWSYIKGKANDVYLSLTGGTITGNINMSSNKITNVATPTDDTDAANKGYVDDSIDNMWEVVSTWT